MAGNMCYRKVDFMISTRNKVPPSSAPKMEALSFFETLADTQTIHGATTQKTNIYKSIHIAVKISNLTANKY
jgi:hypothetical protein